MNQLLVGKRSLARRREPDLKRQRRAESRKSMAAVQRWLRKERKCQRLKPAPRKLEPIDRGFISNFRRGTEAIRKGLGQELERLKTTPLAAELLARLTSQELNLRERRAEQWEKNPSGRPDKKKLLKPVTEYS